jgi:hypothetical protein
MLYIFPENLTNNFALRGKVSMKQLSIDFYRVTMPHGARAFETVVETVSQLAAGAARNLEVSGAPIRLQESAAWQHCVEGEMVRIRMDMLPRKASLAGDLDDLDLDADEGLGEESAFLYDPRMRVLLIQRNRTGVSASSLAWYFKEKGNLGDPINLEPVLQRGVMQKLARMQAVRRLDITVSGLDAGNILQNQGYGVGILCA